MTEAQEKLLARSERKKKARKRKRGPYRKSWRAAAGSAVRGGNGK